MKKYDNITHALWSVATIMNYNAHEESIKSKKLSYEQVKECVF